eukprot:3941262-Rhodomonas_salina.3
MCGTDRAYGATIYAVLTERCYGMCGTDRAYGATECAVLTERMMLPGACGWPQCLPSRARVFLFSLVLYSVWCYATRSTDVAYGAPEGVRRRYHAGAGTSIREKCMVLCDVRYWPIVWCYAMSGAGRVYGAAVRCPDRKPFASNQLSLMTLVVSAAAYAVCGTGIAYHAMRMRYCHGIWCHAKSDIVLGFAYGARRGVVLTSRMNLEALGSVDLPRTVTDCFNGDEGLLLGDSGMELGLARYKTVCYLPTRCVVLTARIAHAVLGTDCYA